VKTAEKYAKFVAIQHKMTPHFITNFIPCINDKTCSCKTDSINVFKLSESLEVPESNFRVLSINAANKVVKESNVSLIAVKISGLITSSRMDM